MAKTRSMTKRGLHRQVLQHKACVAKKKAHAELCKFNQICAKAMGACNDALLIFDIAHHEHRLLLEYGDQAPLMKHEADYDTLLRSFITYPYPVSN